MFPNIGNPIFPPRRSPSPDYRPLLTTRVPLNQSTWRLNAQPVRFIGYRRRSSFERRQQQLEAERQALLEAGRGEEVHDYDALIVPGSESPSPPDLGAGDSTGVGDIPPKLPQTEGHSHAQNQPIVLPEVCRYCQTHESPMSNEPPPALPPQAPKIPGKIVVQLSAQPGPQGTVDLTSRAHVMKAIVDAMQQSDGTPTVSVRFTGEDGGPSSEQPADPGQQSTPTDSQDFSVEDLAKFSGIKYVPYDELDPDIRQYVETRFREPQEQTTSATNKARDSCGICEKPVSPGDEAMNDGSVFPEETKLHFDCVRMLNRGMRGLGITVPEGLLRSVPYDDGSPITINTDGPPPSYQSPTTTVVFNGKETEIHTSELMALKIVVLARAPGTYLQGHCIVCTKQVDRTKGYTKSYDHPVAGKTEFVMHLRCGDKEFQTHLSSILKGASIDEEPSYTPPSTQPGYRERAIATDELLRRAAAALITEATSNPKKQRNKIVPVVPIPPPVTGTIAEHIKRVLSEIKKISAPDSPTADWDELRDLCLSNHPGFVNAVQEMSKDSDFSVYSTDPNIVSAEARVHVGIKVMEIIAEKRKERMQHTVETQSAALMKKFGSDPKNQKKIKDALYKRAEEKMELSRREKEKKLQGEKEVDNLELIQRRIREVELMQKIAEKKKNVEETKKLVELEKKKLVVNQKKLDEQREELKKNQEILRQKQMVAEKDDESKDADDEQDGKNKDTPEKAGSKPSAKKANKKKGKKKGRK